MTFLFFMVNLAFFHNPMIRRIADGFIGFGIAIGIGIEFLEPIAGGIVLAAVASSTQNTNKDLTTDSPRHLQTGSNRILYFP